MTAPSTSSFAARVSAGWRDAFPGVDEPFDEPGTTLLEDPALPDDSWVALCPVGRRVVSEVAPAVAASLRDLLAQRPPGHRLRGDEVASCWPDRRTERQNQHLYGLDLAHFRPVGPAPGHEVRVVTEDDRPAFTAFLSRCPEDDREEGDVDIGDPHEATVGVVDGDRIVAVASMYAWRGFSDIGVLTEPSARRRGAGRAAVSALCQLLADGPRLVVYRHDQANLGSRGIARSLQLTGIGVAEAVRPVAD
ncbi:GNAT family N-acetyltransferase [Egicoccus sp. AB-alg6-2]|uniref:GNAT family N-acetyltransferase n=1 Tax=Egicoccus sp. AB-alg6-2 TaxID=3242692 RepID=UPI00359F007E